MTTNDLRADLALLVTGLDKSVEVATKQMTDGAIRGDRTAVEASYAMREFAKITAQGIRDLLEKHKP